MRQHESPLAGQDWPARSRGTSILLDNLYDGVIVTDFKGHITDWNRGAERMFGYEKAEVVGKTPSIIHAPEISAALTQTIIDSMVETGAWSGEIPFIRKNGSRGVLEAIVVPLRDSVGRSIGSLGVNRDITERRRAEELEAQLHQSQKMEALGQLAGGVAHDFNNLLTAVYGNAEHLLDAARSGPLSRDELISALDEIRIASERAATLTEQLLTFSRQDISKPERIDPAQVIRDMSGILERIVGEHVKISTRVAESLGHVTAEAGRLDQIIMNLAVNAADAMPDGGRITIEAENTIVEDTAFRAYGEVHPGPHVEITVADTGSGIAPGIVEHVFEPFFTTKPVGEGTGLGLSTVYGAVTGLGGHLRVQSHPGRGTAMSAYIPVCTDENVTCERPENEHVPRPVTQVVILCEDDGSVRRLARRTLDREGYRIIEAECGASALEAARAHAGRVDALVTDVVMPAMGGQELAAELAEAHPDLRVLFVSGYPAERLKLGKEPRFEADFLAKPYGPSDLRRKLRSLLETT